MNTAILAVGVSLLSAWLLIEALKTLLRNLEQAIVIVGSIIVATATLCALFGLGII